MALIFELNPDGTYSGLCEDLGCSVQEESLAAAGAALHSAIQLALEDGDRWVDVVFGLERTAEGAGNEIEEDEENVGLHPGQASPFGRPFEFKGEMAASRARARMEFLELLREEAPRKFRDLHDDILPLLEEMDP